MKLYLRRTLRLLKLYAKACLVRSYRCFAIIIVAAVYPIIVSCNSSNEKMSHAYNADTTGITINNGMYYYQSKLFTGKLFALYKNGDTIFSNEYLNGKENGWCRKWYPHHQLAEARFFVNGKKEGHHTAYFINGNKKFDYHLHSDLFEGLQQEWFANGKLYSRKNFVNGYEQGIQQAWDSTGNLIINYEAHNGRNYGNIGKKNCRSLWSSDSFAVVH